MFTYSPNCDALVTSILDEVSERLWERVIQPAQGFDGTGRGAINGPEEDIQDRARMILASSAFLAKMVFDGVSEKRRNAFVQHVLEPLASTI